MSAAVPHCRLCGSTQHRVIDTESRSGVSYTIARCRRCSLVYTQEAYASVSPDYVGLHEQDLNAKHIWLQTEHKAPAFTQCLQLISSYASQNQKKKDLPRLLDVGCGVGGWLRAAQAAYECYGFDASKAQVDFVRQSFPNVRCATSLEEYQEQMGHELPGFELITLWDVLEHIRNPVEFLPELTHQLSSGGLLFASVPAATPMIIKSRLIPFGWPRSRFSWNPHEHVVYYSPNTLRTLCDRSGLRVLKIGSVVAYPRLITLFELLRRCWFRIAQAFPTIAPQIYVLAQKV